MIRVDSHLHVWLAAGGPTPGIETIVSPQTDVPIEQARQTLDAHGIERAVLVQPIFRGDDNSYLAVCARAEPQRFAAVCVVDPRAADAPQQLEHWFSRGCRGLRLRAGPNCDPGQLDDPVMFPLWEAAQRLGVVISVLCPRHQMPRLAEMSQKFPAVPVVIDHLGLPDPTQGETDPDLQALLAMSRLDNIYVKLSGFYHFSKTPLPYADCRSIVQSVLSAYPADRLMWGSDFPHCTLRGGYTNNLEVLDELLPPIPPADRAMILGGTARGLYWPDVAHKKGVGW